MKYYTKLAPYDNTDTMWVQLCLCTQVYMNAHMYVCCHCQATKVSIGKLLAMGWGDHHGSGNGVKE